jgi:arginine deiminase
MDIHLNIIMKSMDDILFEDIFPWKEAQENHLFKRTITLK